MPKINILNILPGDQQTILIDKVNYNFDQILTAGGGPQGPQGLKGSTGSIGPQGIQGPTGPQGQKGARWYVQTVAPSVNTLGVTPWGEPELGDYWLSDETDPNHPYGIYVYNDQGNGQLDWDYSGVFFNNSSLFTAFDGGNHMYQRNILHDSDKSKDYSLVISDYGIINGAAGFNYDHGGAGIPTYSSFAINSEKAKLKIATDPSGYSQSLLSFGRANEDNYNYNSASYSNSNNPKFKWRSPGLANSYDLLWEVPNGDLDVILGSTTGTFYQEADTVRIYGKSVLNGVSTSIILNRSGNSNTFYNYGTGSYYAEGSKMWYNPAYSKNEGNLIVGDDVTNPGTKGLVISAQVTSSNAGGNGRSLVFKGANTEGSYGSVVAEKQSGSTPIAGISFVADDSPSDTRIDFQVGKSGLGENLNRLRLDSSGNLGFIFGSLTGSNRDAKIYIQGSPSGVGANLTLIAGEGENGNDGGGSLTLSGGRGGALRSYSGNVKINPGFNPDNNNGQGGSIYLHTTYGNGVNTYGVGIGLPETNKIYASLVVGPTVDLGKASYNKFEGDILHLKKISQVSGRAGAGSHFFGFDQDGYLTVGLPYNPDLYDGTSGYELSSNPNNLDYYAEGDWSSTLQLLPNGNGTGWDYPTNAKTIRSRFTRIGDTVHVDFVIKTTLVSKINVQTPASNGYLYLTGFPYNPDFTRNVTSDPTTDYINPAMPRVPLKGSGFVSVSTNTVTIPPGTIIPWPGTVGSSGSTNTVPQNWHICDGRTLNKSDWPVLSYVIGNIYGGVQSGATFQVPNLAGKFIRGFGDIGNGNASLGLGSVQGDDFRSHNHLTPWGEYWAGTYGDEGSGLPGANASDNDNRWYFTRNNGGAETRPINLAMNYIIYGGLPASSTTTTSVAQQVDLGGAFVNVNGETRMYLYTSGGFLSIDSIPGNTNAYISGSFHYFTESSTTYQTGVCGTPINLSAAVNSATSMIFTWQKGAGIVSSVLIESSTDQNTWSTVFSGSAQSPKAVTVTAVPQTTTFYRISQTCSGGSSSGAYSPVYQYSPAACAAPVITNLITVTATSAQLSWTPGSGVAANSYPSLEVSQNQGQTWTTLVPSVTVSPFNITSGLLNGYDLRLKQQCVNTSYVYSATVTFSYLAPAGQPVDKYAVTTADTILNANAAQYLRSNWGITIDLWNNTPNTTTATLDDGGGTNTRYTTQALINFANLTGTYYRVESATTSSLRTWRISSANPIINTNQATSAILRIVDDGNGLPIDSIGQTGPSPIVSNKCGTPPKVNTLTGGTEKTVGPVTLPNGDALTVHVMPSDSTIKAYNSATWWNNTYGTGVLSNSPACPDPATPIMISPTESVLAGQLKVGDLVYTAKDPTMEWGYYGIVAWEIAIRSKVSITFDDGSEMKVSDTHKFFMSNEEWKKISEVSIGDSVFGYPYDKVITSISKIEDGEVVTFEVKDAHTYIANGLLSHNRTVTTTGSGATQK